MDIVVEAGAGELAAALGQRIVDRELGVLVQFLEIGGDLDALGVLPRALADAVARIDRASALRRDR